MFMFHIRLLLGDCILYTYAGLSNVSAVECMSFDDRATIIIAVTGGFIGALLIIFTISTTVLLIFRRKICTHTLSSEYNILMRLSILLTQTIAINIPYTQSRYINTLCSIDQEKTMHQEELDKQSRA